MSLLIIVPQIIFWDCRVHFKVLLFARNNCIRLNAYLQLHMEWERCQLNEELVNIQKLEYQNYMNSQITL